jgi:hypothetical protein
MNSEINYSRFTDVSPLPCKLKKGDMVTYTNDNQVSFPHMMIIGFDKPDAYGRFIHINSGSWWFPHGEAELTKEASYEVQVTHLINLLDSNADINDNYCEMSHNDNLSLLDAVSSFFAGATPAFKIAMNGDELDRYLVKIEGRGIIKEAVIPPTIKQDQKIEFTFADRTTLKVKWNKSLNQTVLDYIKRNT